MWSYVQYRRMGRDVRAAAKRAPEQDTHEQGAEKTLQDPEKNNTAPKSDGLASNDSKDDRIWVTTDGDDDPFDPKNWPLTARAKNIFILTLLIFVQAWAGAAESMANTAASQEFHVSKVAESLSTAMYLFGIGSGSLFAGPLSETVGRNPVYLISSFCYLLFVLGAALTPTFGGQLVCRYFIGLFASATLSINGSSVRDQFRSVKRSFVFPIIAWANVTAPVTAPIVGGWIVSHPRLGWRWTEWMTLIISAAAFLLALLFLPETFLPVLLDWRAKQLRTVTGNQNYVSEHAESASFFKKMREVLPLPAKFFAGEPVVAVLGSYLVLLYVLLFTFLSGFDYIFKETYKLSVEMTGTCFAAIAAGATFFTFSAPALYSWARHKTEHVRGRQLEPEFRLWPAIVMAPLLPVCLFWLGWTNYSTVSIWAGLGACFVFGMVLIAIYVSSYEYIIDSYGDHSAIALASITMVRYMIAGSMVIAARRLYEGIGVHWTMTLLGCIAAVLAPAPLIFWRFGRKLRKRSKYAKGPEEI